MKQFLIPLTLLFLLTACSNPTNNKGGEDPSGQDPNGNEPSGGNDPNPSSGSGSGTTNPQRIVSFYDGTFVGQLQYDSVQSNLKSYINGDTDLLSSLSFTGKSEAKELEFGAIENGESVKEKHVVWWMGSSSDSGKLTLNFNYEIESVKLEVQAYHKPYVDHWTNPGELSLITGVDTNAKLFVDSVENVFDLSVTDSSVIPQIKTIDIKYDKPVKTMTIGNLEESERVFIHKIEFTYLNNN